MPSAPQQLIDADGKPVFGSFDTSVQDLAIEQFKFNTVMDKPASSLKKHFSFKQFQFICIHSEEYIIGAAIADIRYAGSAFLYLYNKNNQQLTEHNWLLPPSLFYTLSQSPFKGIARAGSKNKFIAFNIENGTWHVRIQSPEIEAELSFDNSNNLPLAMCTPTAYTGWTYTEKRNALSVNGELSIHKKNIDLKTTLAGYDFSAGFMRRETNWRWASINSHNNGQTVGLNLANGVNETGDNENVLWLDGERYYLPAVQFKLERQASKHFNGSTWHILSNPKDNQANINLSFNAENIRQERINIGILKSNFRQYVGRFNGTIITACGKIIKLENCPGLTEDHYAKW